MQIVGLDIGGSKTHAVSSSEQDPTAEVSAGSANLSSVGEAEAGRQLDAIFVQLADRGTIGAVCAGAAGVDTPEAEERLRRLIAARLPGAVVRVVHDTELILAAAELTVGIALIAGTGSVAWGRDGGGRVARAGGWGYLLGDEGSGYGIVREAVRHALRLVDECQTPDRLSQELVAAYNLQRSDQLLDHFYANPERRYWAGQARVVFELAAGGDPAARRIVDGAAADLARLVRTVHAALGQPTPPLPVVLGGGVLVHQSQLQDALRQALAVDGLTDLRPLDRDPAHGALFLARQLSAPKTSASTHHWPILEGK
jgi:N-acetylglucosamine kinase-like BadF-type ATPase